LIGQKDAHGMVDLRILVVIVPSMLFRRLEAAKDLGVCPLLRYVLAAVARAAIAEDDCWLLLASREIPIALDRPDH
jgi:hypothetical protein